MTKNEKQCIFDDFEKVTVSPDEPMNLVEMKAYIKGFEDARNAMFDSVDKCYISMKTD